MLFLDATNALLIKPRYPKTGNDCPAVGLQWIMRIHFLQQFFNRSDPAVAEVLYDLPPMRQFAGIDMGREPVTGKTKLLKFRHRLERHDLDARLFG